MSQIQLNTIINEDLAGLRLDQALAKSFPSYSRSQIQQWIETGQVTVNKTTINKCKERVIPGQIIELSVELQDQEEWQPESIPLEILFEDNALLVLNKPPGLVVHPGAGNPKSTLVNALLHHYPPLKKIPRAGLIHRLDKDTSGLLLIAKDLSAHHFLTQQMQAREIHRIYHAIVVGEPRPTGSIDIPIGRHTTQRTKMAIQTETGKHARTHYKVLEKFKTHSYLEIELETGRTHQIRVHMSHVGHPILGDPLYGKPRTYPRLEEELAQAIVQFKRQALHAKKLAFRHPVTQEILSFETNLPADFQALLSLFQEFA